MQCRKHLNIRKTTLIVSVWSLLLHLVQRNLNAFIMTELKFATSVPNPLMAFSCDQRCRGLVLMFNKKDT